MSVLMFLINQCGTIYDIQANYGNVYTQDTTDCYGQTVTITGVVFALGNTGTRNIYIYEQPTGKYRGILIYSQTNAYPATLQVGDSIVVTGDVTEYFGNTEIFVDATLGGSITILSSGHTLPSPILVTADSIDTLPAWYEPAESYEHVLVRVETLIVTEVGVGGFGTWQVARAFDGNKYIYFRYGFAPLTYTPQVGDVINIQGVVYTRFGRYVLVPRDDNDIEVLTLGVSTAYAIDKNTIRVIYTQDVSALADVINTANYALSPALNITSAQYDPTDNKAVLLTTDPQTGGTLYTLYVQFGSLNDSAKFYGAFMPITEVQSNFVVDTPTPRYFPSIYDTMTNKYPMTMAGVLTGSPIRFEFPYAFMQATNQPFDAIVLWGLANIPGFSATEGDSLILVGIIIEYQGVTELTQFMYHKVIQGPFPYDSAVVTVADLVFANDSSEMWEGSFVYLDSVVVLDTTGDSYTIADKNDLTQTIFLDKFALTTTYNIGDVLRVKGNFRRIGSVSIVHPRFDTDVVLIDQITGIREAIYGFNIVDVKPTRNALLVQYTVSKPTDMSIKVYALNGRMVASKFIKAENSGVVKLPVSLKSGVYILKVNDYKLKFLVR